MKQLSKTYEPKQSENKWYDYWTEKDYFHAKPDSKKTPFTIMIPPPNVTGMLTMGHVLNNTLQDVLVRKARMEGFETLWLPGTDHAGIATQTAVEKSLKIEGKTRHDYKREDFVDLVWDWKKKYGGIIIEQLKKLGVSCDWEREVFTLDESLSKAVREVFVRLYEKGYIYKGRRIINWCPVSHTALSDEEVIFKESNGKLWYFKYPLADDSETFIVVATTRPETMLGDTGIAVNPHDERYADMIGKKVLLPIIEREIPIFADHYVDKDFGTGAVKVTPAHDPNDYAMGQRHQLDMIDVMNHDGTMNDRSGKDFTGLDRYVARKKIVSIFEEKGLLLKTEDYTHSVGYSERAGVAIEPRLSEQWFVKMDELAKPALEAVNSGQIKFTPERWVKTYNHWLENIKDWCISRQLWWGHRIPVFYCDSCGWESAETETPAHCPKCNNINIRQDEDVLDTWFSSWLWPFSTMGWPDDNKDLQYFYPTNDLVTAPDIIFFWVARMIMAGIEFKQEIPFENVYFTGIIRDEQGRKMSKSLGNSPDPLDIIAKYGADALRFGILLIAPSGQDIYFKEERIEIGRNFMNKLWNATRFILMNMDDTFTYSEPDPNDEHFELADRWVMEQMNKTIESVNTNLDKYRFNDAAKDIYEFTWNTFCDWYIEILKIRFYGENEEKKQFALRVAISTLRTILKLLHPYAPFITEEIWQSVKLESEPDIIVADYPKYTKKDTQISSAGDMELIISVITAIRTIRSEMTVPPSKKADVIISGGTKSSRKILSDNADYLTNLGKIHTLTLNAESEKPKLSASAVVGNLQIYIPLEGLIDLEKEKERLQKEIVGYEGRLKGITAKLSNSNFTNRAPADVVENERKKEKSYLETLALLRGNLAKFME